MMNLRFLWVMRLPVVVVVVVGGEGCPKLPLGDSPLPNTSL